MHFLTDRYQIICHIRICTKKARRPTFLQAVGLEVFSSICFFISVFLGQRLPHLRLRDHRTGPVRMSGS